MDEPCYRCLTCTRRWNRQHTKEYRDIHNTYMILTRVVVARLPIDEADVDYMTVSRAMLYHPTNKQATVIQKSVRGWLRRMENVRKFEYYMQRIDFLERTGLSNQPQLRDFNAQFLARARVHRVCVRYRHYDLY